MLRVNAASLAGPRPERAFDVVVDARGELSVVLLALRHRGPGRQSGALPVFDALRVAQEALLARAPTYELIGALRGWLRERPEVMTGIHLLRFSQPDSRVEILNAGMPPIVCASTSQRERVTQHAALSGALGERGSDSEVHPYELSPLLWGSSWFLMSDGYTPELHATASGAESLSQRPVRASGVPSAFGPDNDVFRRGPELSAASPTALHPILEEHRNRDAGGRDDAAMLVVHADPTRRYESPVR